MKTILAIVFGIIFFINALCALILIGSGEVEDVGLKIFLMFSLITSVIIITHCCGVIQDPLENDRR
jgi:hypothetical protein